MKLKSYQVALPSPPGQPTPAEPGAFDSIGQEIGSWSLPLKMLGSAVVGMVAIAAAPIEVGALAIAGSVLGIGALAAGGVALVDQLINQQDSPRPVIVSTRRQLDRYHPFEGQGNLTDGYYIEHPNRSRQLLPASNFHTLIEDEQIQEIIRFIRSMVKVRSLGLIHQETEEGSASGKVPRTPSASAKGNRSRKVLASFTYERPARVALKRPLIWQHTYQELRDGLRGATGGGTAKYVLTRTGAFSLDVGLAGIIGANIGYLNNRHIEVELVHG